jgi:hypothetical protein
MNTLRHFIHNKSKIYTQYILVYVKKFKTFYEVKGEKGTWAQLKNKILGVIFADTQVCLH